jgi:hypothetical protein
MGFGGLGCEVASNCKRFKGSFNGRVWVNNSTQRIVVH